MWKALAFIQKNLTWAIPISIFFGFIYGTSFDAAPLKSLIVPVTFLMIYPMMVTMNIKSVFKGSDKKLQITAQLCNFVLIPLVAYFIGAYFFGGSLESHGLWAVGLFLIGLLPTSGMTISWTGFAKGNKEAATKMVVFGMVLGAMVAPVYTKLFMGATVDVNILHMFKQIAIFVVIPLIVGIGTQLFLKKKYGTEKWMKTIKPKFPPFSALGVVFIAFLAMSLKAKTLVSNPGDILVMAGPIVLFYVVSYILLTLIGKALFNREDAIAMVFGVVMRNLSIALAIAITAFGKEGATIALLISLAYVIQIQSATWYIKFVDRIFGEKTAPKSSESAVVSTQFESSLNS